MARLWWFYSFCPERFAAFFDGSVPDAERRVVDAATWEGSFWRDPSVPARLAARMTAGGIRYDGLSAADAAALDQLLPMLFSPEGLAEQWEVVAESPDGLPPSVVQELLPRVTGAVLLPVLVGGRRFGEAEPSACEYCCLSPAECGRLVDEVERALASGGPWSGAWLPEVVGECLLGPLQSSLSTGRPLFGSLG